MNSSGFSDNADKAGIPNEKQGELVVKAEKTNLLPEADQASHLRDGQFIGETPGTSGWKWLNELKVKFFHKGGEAKG